MRKNEINLSQPEIKSFLIAEFKKIRNNKYFEELLSIHMNPNTLEERYPMILEKVDQIVMF